ncbi:ABC transporter permease [Jonesia quinghaiensis]|uniref:ABC transporter permease n=1 Tax=Jonesia quinghaiensis TaxID=262806 RepID=UPI000415AB63|nr:ABC transporter permease [Jonesia quinghaiensis]
MTTSTTKSPSTHPPSTHTAAPAADATTAKTAEGTAAAKNASPSKSSQRHTILRKKTGAIALALPVPLVFLALWQLGVQQAWSLPLGIQMGFLPTPVEVARRIADFAVGGIVNDAFSGTLLIHLWASTQRVLAGFAIAAALAIPLGVLMGRSRILNDMLEPGLNLLRPIPVTAWVPLAMLIIGYGDMSTIFLVVLAAFFPILINTVAGVQQVPVRLLEAAAMLGTPQVQTLYKVVIPAASRSIVAGMRVALGLAWVILVVGETVGISTGLGATITQARDMSKTDLIVAGMVIIGIAGFLADRLLVGLIKVLTKGRPTLT